MSTGWVLLRFGRRPRRHCWHLKGELPTVYHQPILPTVLRQRSPILFWLNLDSKAEVDELFAHWKAAHAKIVSEPEDKPWKLRKFMPADLDGNLMRVFYDSGATRNRTTHRAKSSRVYRLSRITGKPDA
jgi:hypothetical protein